MVTSNSSKSKLRLLFKKDKKEASETEDRLKSNKEESPNLPHYYFFKHNIILMENYRCKSVGIVGQVFGICMGFNNKKVIL